MKRIIAITMGLIIFTFYFINPIGKNNEVEGANYLNKTYTKSHLFGVITGGFSSCRVWISYTEYYKQSTKASNKNTFYKRNNSYGYDNEYISQCPSFTLNYVCHRNGSGEITTTFTTWSNDPAVLPGGYDFITSKKNSWDRDRLKTTEYKAEVSYTVFLQGGIIPTEGGLVTLNLIRNKEVLT